MYEGSILIGMPFEGHPPLLLYGTTPSALHCNVAICADVAAVVFRKATRFALRLASSQMRVVTREGGRLETEANPLKQIARPSHCKGQEPIVRGEAFKAFL